MARPRSAAQVLPIDHVLPTLASALEQHSSVVLQAPPGAGKTTRVPLELLHAPWLGGGRIVMLEPRRLAARAAARRMAFLLDEPVGQTVGVRVRGETRVSGATRLEVVTEGVLTRMLHADVALEGVGLLVFDEFHERSLHADLGLALALETQSLLRPDLRILVMSATLDGAGVASLLGDAPIVVSEGRAHPVDTRYVPRRAEQSVEAAVVAAIRRALAECDGSVLAFLPGAAEIMRTAAMLTDGPLPSDVKVLPLFGSMPTADQDEAIRPPLPGVRKVVLATSIAETSLTIEGVRVVVDAGLARVPSFSPRSGMSRLETVRASRAAAEQRCGRAGRTAPGVCYRLWAPEEQIGLMERDRPEILQADLAPLALDLAMAGVADPRALRWLDLPPAPALGHARELLQQLGALTSELRLTSHGRTMASLGVHPRVAHMLLRGAELGFGATACVVAALLEERDPMRRSHAVPDPDLAHRVALVASRDRSSDADRAALHRIREQAQRLRALLEIPSGAPVDEMECGRALALAFPDRVAQRRVGEADRYLLRNGSGAVLSEGASLTGAPYLAVAELGGQRPYARISLAAALSRSDLDALFGDQTHATAIVEWRAGDDAVVAVQQERLGALVLREAPLRDVDPTTLSEALLNVLTTDDGIALRWSAEAMHVRERLAFLHRHVAGWPDVSDRALHADAREWLLPHLVGVRRRSELNALDLGTLLLARLSWSQRASLDALAPTHIEVPSGSRIRVDYGDAEAPVLAVRLQELFGLATTPTVADGRVPLTLHLLSPAHRPVQVTRDLAGFWRSAYFDVRKELRGRYPKHPWPEDPLHAEPTRRTKPRR